MELSQLAFEFFVDRLRAADEPHRRHAVPKIINSFLLFAGDLCVVSQAQVVVGAEVKNLTSRRSLRL